VVALVIAIGVPCDAFSRLSMPAPGCPPNEYEAQRLLVPYSLQVGEGLSPAIRTLIGSVGCLALTAVRTYSSSLRPSVWRAFGGSL